MFDPMTRFQTARRALAAWSAGAALLGVTGGILLVAASVLPELAKAGPIPPAPTVTVYKSATCHCCSKWVEHLRQAGFPVKTQDTASLADLKRNAGVPEGFGSCHTAFVEGYVIEGHVPVADIQRLLRERPKATGIAAPGMPIGSPGMEVGERRDPYDVMLFGPQGQQVYARHGS